MAVNRRKDRKYDTLEEVILAFNYKELVAFFYTIGICNIKGVNLFTFKNWKELMAELKDWIIKFEVEKSIYYKEFRSVLAKLIYEKSNKNCHESMIKLAIETFGTVDEDLSLKNAEKIFENLENKNKNNLISKLFGI